MQRLSLLRVIKVLFSCSGAGVGGCEQYELWSGITCCLCSGNGEGQKEEWGVGPTCKWLFFSIDKNELPVLLSKSFKLVIDSSYSYFLASRWYKPYSTSNLSIYLKSERELNRFLSPVRIFRVVHRCKYPIEILFLYFMAINSYLEI